MRPAELLTLAYDATDPDLPPRQRLAAGIRYHRALALVDPAREMIEADRLLEEWGGVDCD